MHKNGIKITEQMEVNIPLKTLISVGAAILIAAWYVFSTQERIYDIETQLKSANERPSRDQGKLDLLELKIEDLRRDVDELKKK